MAFAAGHHKDFQNVYPITTNINAKITFYINVLLMFEVKIVRKFGSHFEMSPF